DGLLVLLRGLWELAERLVRGAQCVVRREGVIGVAGGAGQLLDGALMIAALLVQQAQAIEDIAARHAQLDRALILLDRAFRVAGLLVLLGQRDDLLDREL